MIRVISDEAIIGGRTTSGGRPGPVFSAEQRFERRTRPLTVDEIVSSWREIKLMSVLKWGEKVESSVGWDGRRMMPAGLQSAVDACRADLSRNVPGEQVVYEELKPLLHAALKRGTKIFVMASRGRSVQSCQDVLREAGFEIATSTDEFGIRVVPSDTFASRGLAAADLIATTARPGENWHIIDSDVEELERYIQADFGEAYASLTEGVRVTLRHAAYAYTTPGATQRGISNPNIQSLTNDAAQHLALNFLGDYAHLMGR
jgi:rhodanese-related sulfurtransferase